MRESTFLEHHLQIMIARTNEEIAHLIGRRNRQEQELDDLRSKAAEIDRQAEFAKQVSDPAWVVATHGLS